jgi:acetyl-CoA carboxylase biotin carboxyl carrier protein
VSENPDVDAVARLMDLASRYGLEELEVEESGLKVTLVAQPAIEGEEGEPSPYLWRPPWSEPSSESGPGRPETARAFLAPLTGMFYRAESPDSPPFVELGQTVEEGQTIGLIEAMKFFSKVESDVAGVVLEIVARNGTLVHHGDVLMYVDPIAT